MFVRSPGWYVDPSTPETTMRWWSGAFWTSHTKPLGQAPHPPSGPPNGPVMGEFVPPPPPPPKPKWWKIRPKVVILAAIAGLLLGTLVSVSPLMKRTPPDGAFPSSSTTTPSSPPTSSKLSSVQVNGFPATGSWSSSLTATALDGSVRSNDLNYSSNGQLALWALHEGDSSLSAYVSSSDVNVTGKGPLAQFLGIDADTWLHEKLSLNAPSNFVPGFSFQGTPFLVYPGMALPDPKPVTLSSSNVSAFEGTLPQYKDSKVTLGFDTVQQLVYVTFEWTSPDKTKLTYNAFYTPEASQVTALPPTPAVKDTPGVMALFQLTIN